mmetsp:Transcript_4404/g.9506  ORF Transcript_4404/g.9506 Transcript_4404/m.9506 type:complete len:366 (+) Transcript_4404:650-1747(+)
MDVDTQRCGLSHLLRSGHLGNLSHELHDIKGQLVGACVGLHDGSEEGLGVEEAGQPHAEGRDDVAVGPVGQLLVALEYICVPCTERVDLLHTGRHLAHPQHGHGVGRDTLGQRLHLLAHVERAVQAQLQLLHRALHLDQQRVHAPCLLQRHHHERCLVLHAGLNLHHAERLRQLLHVPLQVAAHGTLAAAASARTSATTARHLNHGAEQGLAQACQQGQLSVGVHAVHHWRLSRQRVLNVVTQAVVVGGHRGLEAGCQLQVGLLPGAGISQAALGQDLRPDEHLQVGGAAAPVHAVSDVATVEHLTEHVPQVGPGDLLVGLQVVEQHVTAGSEITHVEGVAAAEAQAAAAACADTHAELLAAQQQ